MANKRLSDLPVVTSTTTGDVAAIDGATTRKITVENLLGDNVQSIKDLTSAADKVPYFTGAGTSDVADFTTYGRSVVAVADEAAFKTLTNLEIGTDVQAYSSALDAVSGTNTGDQTITLTGDVTGSGTGSFATTISATAVTSSMLNPDVFSTAHSWSGQQTFVAPALGTPTSGVATNLTGTASGLTAGHVTTNANLTGDVTSVGNATTIAANAVTNAKLATASDGTIKSNISGSTATPSDNTITAVLDKLFGTTQGSVIYRGASSWAALTPGTSGNFLKTQGSAANPVWDSIPGGGDMLSTNNLSDVASVPDARESLGLSTYLGVTARSSFVFDMHWRALRGVPWDTSDPGSIVSYTIASSASAGGTSLTVSGTAPVAQQLLVILGDDGEYYTVSTNGVSGSTVTLSAALPIDVSAGSTLWNFYINESHPNEYGYRAIADELVRSLISSEREIYRGLQPSVVGTATVAESTTANAFTPGGANSPAYLVTPAAAGDGCSWSFTTNRAGRYRARFKINTAGGSDVHFIIKLNGTTVYDWNVPKIADGYPQEFCFEVSDIGTVSLQLVRNTTTTIFIVSQLSILEMTGADLAQFSSGRHVMLGDSWFAIASDDSLGDYGIIDRLRDRFPNATWINKGVGGNDGPALVARFDADVTPQNPDFVHILGAGGTNGYYGGNSVTTEGNALGFLRSRTIEIGAIPIAYTGSVGSATANPTRFALSRQYVSEIKWWDYEGDRTWELDNSVWTSYTPSVTTSSGSFTTVSASGVYKRIGRTVFFSVVVHITTNGTAVGVTVANPINSNGVSASAYGRETAVGGKMLQAVINTTNTNIYNYDNTNPNVNGSNLVVSGFYAVP